MDTQNKPFVMGSVFASAVDHLAGIDPDKLDYHLIDQQTRLLVPVDVKAMVVAENEQTQHATVFRMDTIKPSSENPSDSAPDESAPDESASADIGSLKPPVFKDEDDRKPGVYLHWALPDGLTAGFVTAKNDLSMPVLPNRWVVLRLQKGRKRKVKGWVIESDRGRTVDLESWHEQADSTDSTDNNEGRTPEFPPEELTAVAGGPGWAATFDTAEDRFSFYDDLQGLHSNESLSYLVCGWYSEASLDPLAEANSLLRFHDITESMGWFVSDDQMNAAKKALIKRNNETSALLQSKIPAPHLEARMDATLGVYKKYSKDIKPLLIYWPQQSLYHGAVFGVQLSKKREDSRPTSSKVSIAIGQNAEESMASLVSSTLPASEQSTAERLHLAFQYHLTDMIDDVDAIPYQDETFHKMAFDNKQGGYITERVKTGDPFAHLRPSQTSVSAADYGQLAKEDLLANENKFKGNHTYVTDGLRDKVKDPGYIDPTDPLFSGGRPDHHSNNSLEASRLAASQSAVNFDFIQSDIGSNQSFHTTPRSTPRSAPKSVNAASRATQASATFNHQGSIQQIHQAKQAGQTGQMYNASQLFRQESYKKPSATIQYKNVRRALPRLFYPQNPVISLHGLNRNLRHGFDGRFDGDEKLGCRLTGTTITELSGLSKGNDLLEQAFFYPALPYEVVWLLYEAILIDPTPVAIENKVTQIAATKKLDAKAVETRLKAEAKLISGIHSKQWNTTNTVAYSIMKGVLPSPVARNEWQQPWIPLYLEWEVDCQLDKENHQHHWELDELDFEQKKGESSRKTVSISGSTLLNASSAKTLSSAINKFLIEEDKLDNNNDKNNQGQLDEASEETLSRLGQDALYTDTLSSSMEGFHQFLLGFETQIGVAAKPNDEPDESSNSLKEAELTPPTPTLSPELLISGQADFTRMRIVDSFGRVLDIKPPQLKSLSMPDYLVSEDKQGLQIRPRILQPSRLWFRFVDATNDQQDANVNQETDTAERNPVAGWLVADHIDRALEVFTATGDPVGQLRHNSQDRAVIWEGVPGQATDMGAAPADSIENPHVAEFARSLVERDAVDRNRYDKPDKERETLLNALLRVIDTTLWSVNPFGNTGTEFYSVLTGRPIAIVRARLKLEVISDLDVYDTIDPEVLQQREEAYNQLYAQKFAVRLGALTRFDDGLLGYFVNDDYYKFYPVHNSVPKEAIKTGRFKGFAGSIKKVKSFSKKLDKEIVNSPYIEHDPTVSIRPGESTRLTLLMDPGAAVHATSGILPRKSITLPRAFIEAALNRIAPSFRIGPVLVDPQHIRMPKPKGLPKKQVWTRRDSPNSWKDDPITAATQDALLPDESAHAQEGYLRVTLEKEV